MNLQTIFFSMLLVIAVTGCYYDNEEELFGVQACDLENVSYQNEILPILEARCYACHSSTNHNDLGSGILLEGYNAVKILAEQGALYGSVKQDGTYAPMPDGGRLSDCAIDQIGSWVSDGALNN